MARDSGCRCILGILQPKMRLVLLLMCSLFGTGIGLQLLRLDVPGIADPRWDRITLKCEYDLGGEELYSVKWYKDGGEFFRFMPGSRPPGRDFPVNGVLVDVSRSDSKQVTLLGQANNRRDKVKLEGSYGCEVSSEGPSFLTIYGEANMTVAVPPRERPSIRGFRSSYRIGDTLQVECSSAESYPPGKLALVLNGKQVNKASIKELPSIAFTEDSVVSSSRLRYTLHLERRHFPGGILSLTCQSTLPGILGARALERTETATLTASNQRLAQQAPRSGCGINKSFLSILIYCALVVYRFIDCGDLTAPII